MYTPKPMQLNDQAIIKHFLNENSFAVMISDDLSSTHLPLVYEADEGEKGTFYGHIAKANPHWKNLDKQDVLLVFSGAHAYVSPTWYVEKPAVPTWNYASVHCRGKVELLSEEDTVQALLHMVDLYEPNLKNDAEMMPDELLAKLYKAIVGLKVTVHSIEATEKLGQHKSLESQRSVFNALKDSTRLGDKQLAEYMLKRDLGIGSH